MAARTKAMSQIKQILRLRLQGNDIKPISRMLNISKNTVKRYLQLAGQTGKSVSDLLELSDIELEHFLYGPQDEKIPIQTGSRYEFLLSQMPYYEKELHRTGVNRWVLWMEYRTENKGGYCYGQFCYLLSEHFRQKDVSYISPHLPADQLYIDFAGKPLQYTNPGTGEIIPVQIFLGSMGYSGYSFVTAVASQKVEDFLDALQKCLQYLGGVPASIIPDNLKSAVIKTDRYELDLNRLLEDMANHYSTTILPARVSRPRDKPLVEKLVNIAYSRIYAPLRNREFFSLGELNQAITLLLDEHNAAAFKSKPESRKKLFLDHELAKLTPLPQSRFEVKKYRKLTVQKNSHIILTEDRHYYSIPYKYMGKKVSAVYTARTVCVYFNSSQIAAHERNRFPYGYTTDKEHLPSTHKYMAGRNPAYYLEWAQGIAPEVYHVIEKILARATHPEQSYKSCEGIQALLRKTSKQKVIDACRTASELDHYRYKFICSLVEKNQTHVSLDPEGALPQDHENVRGAAYYGASCTAGTNE